MWKHQLNLTDETSLNHRRKEDISIYNDLIDLAELNLTKPQTEGDISIYNDLIDLAVESHCPQRIFPVFKSLVRITRTKVPALLLY
jgi:hypothetical protein